MTDDEHQHPRPGQPAGPPYPAASPAAGPGAARARIRRLHRDGSTYQAIATAAGLAPATVRDLASGRRRPARGTAAAVLAVTAGAIPSARVDAGGTRLRLRALHVMGHGSARIARALGVRETAISELVRGDARTVSPKLRDKVTALYDAWWDKRAPERTRAERGAATAARRRAIAGNWCAAAALDDDQLDIPGYRPRQGWKPATGTGIAPEHPPARPPPPQEEGRMRDHRIGLDLFTDVLDVLDRHGFARGDDEHAGRAIFLIGDLARIYEGTQDHPSGPAVNPAPFPQTAPEPSGQDSHDAVIVPASELKTVLIALDIAADYMRDRAEMCTDCPDQSCPACQSRLHDAQAYDQMAGRMLQAAEAAPAARRGQAEPAGPPRQPGLAAGKEAGQ